jgi:hypothetical protein
VRGGLLDYRASIQLDFTGIVITITPWARLCFSMMDKGEDLMKNNEKEVPFFARFLEGQEFPQVRTDVKAGIKATTKFPSDQDELAYTQKYPSDNDEY